MGFAKEKMDNDSRAAIAADLFVVKSKDLNRNELIGLCPIHGESNPSFAYNTNKDVYFCQSCQATGDLVDLWCKVNGHGDPKEGFKSFCRTFQINKDQSSSPTAAVSKKTNKKDVPIIEESVWEQMQPLPDSFIKRLETSRGWTKKAIKKLDLRLQTVYLDKDGKTIHKVTRAERIAIPIRNDEGNLVNIRLYKPGAKVGKIMSWGKGYGSAQLFPARPLYISKPVLICEGEPDTICAISHGFNAITQTSKLVNWPTDHKYQLASRDLVIAYDADQAGQDYAWKAAVSLSAVAKSINILQWPEMMGCVYGYWPINHGEDLTDYFVIHGQTVDKFKLLKKSLFEDKKPIEEDSKQSSNNNNKEAPRPPLGGSEFFHMNNQGRWTFKPRWLANRLREDMDLLYDPLTSKMYKYNAAFWDDFPEEHLEKAALEYLGDESTSARSADAAKQARILSTISHGREVNDTELICMENGMLDMSDIKNGEIELKEHNKEYYATYQLPFSFYDNDERKCDTWLRFLSESIVTPEVIMQAQEFAGYCLTKETRYGKALILLGPGSDGKSTFINVIEQLVGKRNSASVALKDLEDQFYRSNIYNKMLCTSTEISKSYFDSVFFKAIVTGDTISAAYKNKDPFDFKPFCKMIFSGNDLPQSRDNSDGFFRRIMPIRFKKQFFGKDDDTHLAEKLQEELPMIMNWAIAGLIRLIKNNGFTQCDETDDMLQQYRIDNNPVMSFVDGRCCLGKTHQVDKDALYREYRTFCDQYNYKSLNRSNFFKELVTAQKNLTMSRPRIDGKQVRIVEGIGLLQEDSGEIPS